MFGRLFRGREKVKPNTSYSEFEDRIQNAQIGGVFTVTGLELEYDEAYFFIEKKNLYRNSNSEWWEVLGVDGDKRVWMEWSTQEPEFVVTRLDSRPIGLDTLGLSEDDLIRMDEKHSIDSTILYEGTTYHYVNSCEAFYFEDGNGEGNGFYMWEFSREDEAKILSMVKWEGVPFQVYINDVISAEQIKVYGK